MQSPQQKSSLAAKVFTAVVYVYMLVGFTIWGIWFGIDGIETYVPASLKPVWEFYAPNSFYAQPKEHNNVEAALTDVGLLLLFSVMHSVCAHSPGLKVLGLPHSVERAIFVLQSMICLHLKMIYWLPFEGLTLYDVRGTTLGYMLYALFFFGLAFMFSATFALDHFSLMGLSQGFGFDFNKALGLTPKTDSSGLSARMHYAFIAHPIMTGFVMMFMGAPVMTAPRFLLAVYLSAYCTLATKYLEEPFLEKEIGPAYSDYLSTVPSFCPFTGPAKPKNASKNK